MDNFSLHNRRMWVYGLLATTALLLPPVLALFGQEYYVTVFSRAYILGLAAVSLDLLIGYGGLVSFGHAAFVGLGAYAVGVFAYQDMMGGTVISWPVEVSGGLSALITWPLAIVGSALAALLIGAISLRTSGVYFIMITLAFAQMLYFLLQAFPELGGGDGMVMVSRSELPGLYEMGIDLGDDNTFYYLCLLVLVGALYCCARLTQSRFGMVIQGARQSERRMVALGYPVYRYRLALFTLAGGLAGLSGALAANQTMFVSPDLLHWSRSGEIMIMVILGGMGSLIGPVLGAIALLFMEEFLAGWTEHWMLILGPLLLLVVLLARGGIWSFINKVSHMGRGKK